MMVVPTDKDESRNRFLAYITDDKVGLHFLPATGNPHLAMALIAHPSGVSKIIENRFAKNRYDSWQGQYSCKESA